MKVIIVTVYDSINSGSFWQARALKSAVESLGRPSVFLERRKDSKASSSLCSVIVNMVKSLLKYGAPSALRYLRIAKAFSESNKSIETVTEKEACLDQDNIIILGSDTIWNTKDDYFSNNWEVFFGKKFENQAVFPYAASVGNTSLFEIPHKDVLRDIAFAWRGVGVRDEYTRSIIESVSGREGLVVCDPTLLFESSFYLKECGEIKEKGYIFLYLFSKLKKEEIKQLTEFAKKKKLRIIIGSTHVKPFYCDEIILNTPENFVKYMFGADYVVTDTYHGTVFAVNFHKEFVSFEHGKRKVKEFLESIGLADRLVNEKTEDFIKKFDQSVSFQSAYSYIEKLRSVSWSYLKELIEEK